MSLPALSSCSIRPATAEESVTIKPVEVNWWKQAVYTGKLVLNGEFFGGMKDAWESGDPYTPCYTTYLHAMKGRKPIYLASDPKLMRQIFQYQRVDSSDDSLFYLPFPESAQNFFGDLFPGEKLSNDDVILFADTLIHDRLRVLIDKHLSCEAIRDHLGEIQTVIESELALLTRSHADIGINALSSFTATVISRVLLGHSEDDPSQLIEAITSINENLPRKYTNQQPSDPEHYRANVKYLADLLSAALTTNRPTPFIAELHSSDLNEKQKKALLAALFFGGQETTSSLLSYILWQLASSPRQQEAIFNDISSNSLNATQKQLGHYVTVLRTVSTALYHHAPAYSIFRIAKKDLVAEYEHDDGSTVKRLIPKDSQINPSPMAAGCAFLRQQCLEDDVERAFDPEGMCSGFRNLPFGAGPHKCPGQFLALLETRLFLVALIRKFTFELSPENPIEPVRQIGMMTLKLSRDVIVKLTLRHPLNNPDLE